mgnify:CR=1 FL=1
MCPRILVNVNSSDEVKELGKKYITWFVEESGFAQKEGSLSALKGAAMPDYLTDFADVEMFLTETPPEADIVGVGTCFLELRNCPRTHYHCSNLAFIDSSLAAFPVGSHGVFFV